jgi:hypothetical protein
MKGIKIWFNVSPEKITSLKDDEIFVFGSNTEGRHGKGAALTARQKFGAIYGQPRGLQGKSYAIVTKDLSKGLRSIPLKDIQKEVVDFIQFAKSNQHLKFLVVELGCSLAGYKVKDIAPLFFKEDLPDNIYLPKSFWKVYE